MRFISFSAVASALLLISTASAGCYTSGDTWDDVNNAKYHVEGICREWSSGATGSGTTRTSCKDGRSSAQHYDYLLYNQGSSRTVPFGDCVTGLTKEIGGCSRGGESCENSWCYRSDPNAGMC
ncbi:hypothetical protein M501DRAFT_1032665 [Patellaria atrata CBS 101060]|uniref:Uncharacterized protein n=1 Tax=Patellaria atrata CBS 101060 TaxID=1346257 RepID=A0A9P4S799_9PEZI|nr:hypothetical protein M501DRAFT_1032665 [Patellaria atrata CBS 101060]